MNVAVGKVSVSRPSLRSRLSRLDSSEVRLVVSTVSVGRGQGGRRPVGLDGDRAGHLVGATDGVALGGQVGQLLADAVAGDAVGGHVPGPGDVAIDARSRPPDSRHGRGGGAAALAAALAAGVDEAVGRRQGGGAVAAQDLVIGDEAADDDGEGDGHGRDDETRSGHSGLSASGRRDPSDPVDPDDGHFL